jgi:hypothetical protein
MSAYPVAPKPRPNQLGFLKQPKVSHTRISVEHAAPALGSNTMLRPTQVS